MLIVPGSNNYDMRDDDSIVTNIAFTGRVRVKMYLLMTRMINVGNDNDPEVANCYQYTPENVSLVGVRAYFRQRSTQNVTAVI
jgi:hypothetical protein